MSNFQLHIVQSTFTRINNCLEEVQQVCNENDIVLLLEDAVLALYSPNVQSFKNLYILENDLHFAQNQQDCMPIKLNVITYTDLATLIAKTDKVLNWR